MENFGLHIHGERGARANGGINQSINQAKYLEWPK